ncbi:hypothetical protein V5O48_010219 [Marasmius crinis-equi]|uniref:DUF6532 domain-containing protein n=1 Tax=Marasmius crinis-equi TaxID=585013 RepID=A0ABR3F919_9AGAR
MARSTKARNTSQARKRKGTNEADMDVEMSPPEETAIPPRRRTRTHDPNQCYSEEAPSRPERRAQQEAKKNQIWMKPEAGCPKGKGATAANEARKRALSVAEEEAQKKRAKAANGDSIPEPSLESDEDQNYGQMNVEEHHAVTKTKAPPVKQPKAPGHKEGSKRAAKPCKYLKPARFPVAYSNGRQHRSTVKYQPPALDEPSSDEDLDSEEDPKDDNQEDDDASDDDEGVVSNTQLTAERATILAKPSKGKSAAKLFDDDNDMAYDDVTEVIRGSSLPPGSDLEMAPSDDSESEPELVRVKAATKTQAAPIPNKAPKVKASAPINTPKTKTASKAEKPKSCITQKPSKREEVHRKEQPAILQKDEISTSLAKGKEWSSEATPIANGKEYKLTEQRPVLKAVLSRGFLVVHKYIMLTNLYPGYTTPATFMRNLFMQAAKDTAQRDGADEDTKKYAKEIFERFRTDSTFVQQLTDIPMTRFLQFRSGSKSVAKTIIDMHYGFTPNLTRSQVKALADSELEGDRFVYDRRKNGVAVKSTIYQHTAIKSVLQQWLFKKHGQMGKKLKRHFVSLGQERSEGSGDVPTNDGELSIPVVAGAAAALHSVLQDKKSFNKEGRFDVNVMEDEYAKHVRTLEVIRTEKPLKFHILMNKLFMFASTDEGTSDILAYEDSDEDSAQDEGERPDESEKLQDGGENPQEGDEQEPAQENQVVDEEVRDELDNGANDNDEEEIVPP